MATQRQYFMPLGPGVAQVFATARLMTLRDMARDKNSELFKKAEQSLLDEIKFYESHPGYRQAVPYGA